MGCLQELGAAVVISDARWQIERARRRTVGRNFGYRFPPFQLTALVIAIGGVTK